MSPDLPARPSLEHLKKQAKALYKAFQDREPAALERFRAQGSAAAKPKLAGAQRIIAREHGFASWARLKEHVEALAPRLDPRQALIAAVHADDVKEARALFARHPALREKINDPDPEIPFGGRPLGAIAGRRQRAMVDLFLEFGADINARSDWWAGSWGVLDSCEPDFAPFLISRGATVDAHAAARLGMTDKLRELVTADPRVVHARGGDGQTPLHFASSIPIADYLLDHGADIDALDVDHEGTPAQWMVRDRPEIARHLVRRGARTDILLAAALGDLDLVRRHLDADLAAVNTTATADHFPMRDPRAGGHIYLWSLGRNKSAPEIAREFGHQAVWRLLLERSPPEVQLVEACSLGDERLIDELLGKHPGLTRALPADARRKLVDAAQDENLAAIRRLLAAGWPTDGRGQENATALHWAGFLGNAGIARELLRAGAAVDVKGDAHDSTPLGWAIHGSVHSWTCKTGDHAGVVQALLDAGASPPAEVKEASASVHEVLRRHAARGR
jgi:ankyrin repeat protein